MEMQFSPDFKEFLALLNSANVEYLVVGGYAVGYYGYPRPTGDLDVWIAVDEPNAAKMARVLSDFGFSGSTSAAEIAMPNQVFRMGLPPVRIEVLTGVSGVVFADCYARRVRAIMDGIPVNLISKSDLVANKKAAGRHKDLADLEKLNE